MIITKTNIIKILKLTAFILIIFVILYALIQMPSYTDDNKITTLTTFFIDGQSITLPVGIDLPVNESITLEKVLPEIKVGDVICIWTNQQNLIVEVDDKIIYEYKMNEEGFFGKMDGSFWHFVSVPPEMTKKMLSLTFSSRLAHFGGQICEIKLGEKSEILIFIFKSILSSFMISFIILIIGFIVIILSLIFYSKKAICLKLRYFGIFIVLCALWMMCETRMLEILLHNYYFVTMLACFCVMFIPSVLFKYTSFLTDNKNIQNFYNISFYVLNTITVIILLLQFFNIIEMVAVLIYYNVLIIIISFPCVYITVDKFFKHRVKENLLEMIASGVLALSAILESTHFIKQNSYNLLGVFLRIGVSIYIITLAVLNIIDLGKTEQSVRNLKTELTQNKLSLMVSLMKPHFLFNTLNSISGLCLTDPIKAEQAITIFSKYLRANIKVFDNNEEIPFTDELDQIKNYIAIEQMRFGNKINIQYDIQVSNFRIPPLSIQVLVENAIKHGIGKKISGGNVWLKTIKYNNTIVITVEDDGVGFCNNNLNDNIHSFGLQYSKNSFKIMKNAHLLIESIPGIGSKVKIIILEV